MILRGDATGILNPEYTVTPGDTCCFAEWGGTWRFRQIQAGFNSIRMEITPTHVNVPTALQIGGTSTDALRQQRSWVQVVLPVATVNGPVTITSQSGVATLTSVSRTGIGTYAIVWSPNISNVNYIVQGNVRNAAGYVSLNSNAVTGCNILTYNAAGVLADLACNFMIFRMP